MTEPVTELHPRRHEYPGETLLWVVWHRLRRHWVHRSGYLVRRGKSARIWFCSTCMTQKAGRAPSFIEWREQG